jgi:prophage endopeptidase
MNRLFFFAWLAVAIGVSVSVTGWGLTGHYTAKIAALKQAQAEQAASEQADALARQLQAQQRGDELTARLQVQEQANTQLQKDKADALRKTTTGGTCFGADTVRVLNRTADTANAPHLPAPAPGPAAADEPIATDTDVAAWVSGAQNQYEQCRQRLDALIDFYQPH